MNWHVAIPVIVHHAYVAGATKWFYALLQHMILFSAGVLARSMTAQANISMGLELSSRPSPYQMPS